MKTKFFIVLIQLFLLKEAFSQDFHLAQFDANPLNLNPAMTGERLTDYTGVQFNCNYRDQIANFTSAPGSYKTIAEGLDVPINSKFSIGQYFGNNKSVGNVFSVTNFMISGSYKVIDKSVDGSGRHNLSVGLQMGVLNNSFNPQGFTYDSQYSAAAADGFDRNIPSGENLTRTNTTQFSSNFGLYYRVKMLDNKLTIFSGFAMNNITKSKEMINGIHAPMLIHYNLNAGAIYKLDERLTLMPQILFMEQNKAKELNIGSLLYYKMANAQEPIIGISWRNKNAFIFHLGLRIKGNTFRASYCVVNSYLATYQNRGLEFSFVHTSAKKLRKVDAPF